MQSTILRLAQVIGLLLMLLLLSGSVSSVARTDADRAGLAVRQIGHDYLTASCDFTSRIPAVVQGGDGSYFLRLARTVSYDTLSEITRNVLDRYDIGQAYTLSLEDCGSGLIFLGSLSSVDGAACLGREQEERCANVRLRFEERNQKSSWPLLAGVIGFLLFLVRPLVGYFAATPGAQAPTNTPTTLLPLGEHCSLDTETQLLRVGEEGFPLTYRESKLLAYSPDYRGRCWRARTFTTPSGGKRESSPGAAWTYLFPGSGRSSSLRRTWRSKPFTGSGTNC